MIITDRHNTHISQVFKVLSNKKRITVLQHIVSSSSPCAVSEIAFSLSFNPHETSQLCSALRKTGMILSERSGKNILYRLNSIFPLSLVVNELSKKESGH